MEEIRIISSSIVHQANWTESTRFQIELTPWDIPFLTVPPIQKGLLFSKPDDYPQHKFVDNLKASLTRTLDIFPPLAGRLVSVVNDDNTTSFYVDCNNKGAEFVRAVADNVQVPDISTPLEIPKIINSLFTLNGIRNEQGVTLPLLGVQLTEFVDGFFIGCTINHSVSDGASFWHFMNSWSEISRGLPTVSKLPNFNRVSLYDNESRVRIPPSDPQLAVKTILDPPSLQQRVFHFSKEMLAELKAKANSEMETDRISSLQALLSHIWRSFVCSNGSDNLQAYTTLKLPIGVRSRLHPPLPEGYYGNAIRVIEFKLERKELVERGLGWIAWKINRMIASQTDEELRKYYERWAKIPRLLIPPKDVCIMLGSPTFNIYGCDFGCGRPVSVRNGTGRKFNGKVTFFEGIEEGSIDAEICLNRETMSGVIDIDKSNY